MKVALQLLTTTVFWVSGMSMVAAQVATARIPPPPTPPTIIHGYVYFDPGSYHAIPRQGDIVRAVVSRFSEASWPTLFLVVGHTDTAGDASYNMELSRRRAIGVAERLVASGVDVRTIHIWACGENRLSRPTPDSVADPLNRRVTFEWLYGPVEPPPLPGVCEVVVFPAR